MRRLIAATLVFLALGPVPGSVQRFPRVDLHSQSVTARPLAFGPEGGHGMLRFVRGWRLTSQHSMFGGFSALALVEPDRFQLVADNGYWARLTLGVDGRVSDARIGLLPTPTGRARSKSQSDVEALMIDAATGQSWVALEGLNQIWRLDPALTRIESRAILPRPGWPANRGPEAMVRLADGRTIVFSEDADHDPRGREALVLATDPAVPGARAVRFYYDGQGKGLVSDAALLPDGRILLVHRKLGLSPIFTTTLAIVDPADIAPGSVVCSVPIGRVPAPLAENYEGAAIEQRGGRTFLWLVSDDNFNSWQRSLLVEFELVGLPDSKKAAR